MKTPICVRTCTSYDVQALSALFRETYRICQGPSLQGRTVLLKPNILIDAIPSRAVTTHPAFLEAAIRFVQEEGAARVWVGDSPAVHRPDFRPVQSGLYHVCETTGAAWLYFAQDTVVKNIGRHTVRIASAYERADVVISLPKLKTHGLMMFTGALKNSFGLIPSLHKARQHAVFSTQQRFGQFLWELNQVCPPDFVFMDGIVGMEGPGPSNGSPIALNVMLASADPLAVDLVAARFCRYTTEEVPLNVIGLQRSATIRSIDDLLYDGPELARLIPDHFKRIRQVGIRNIMFRFVIDRFPTIRRLDRRPVFRPERCAGCQQCIRICPAQTLRIDPDCKTRVLIDDSKCIRCFCCHEVCPHDAIDIRRKIF